MSAPTTAEVREAVEQAALAQETLSPSMPAATVFFAVGAVLEDVALPLAEHRDALADEVAALAHHVGVGDGDDSRSAYVEALAAVRRKYDDMRVERDGLATEVVTIVHELGGEVEGRPTQTINYLQRIRALRRVEVERDALAAEVARLKALLECGASPYGVHRCCHCDSEVA